MLFIILYYFNVIGFRIDVISITEGAPEIDPVLEVASSVIQNIDDVPILILSDEQFTQEGLVNSVQISINLEDLENIVDFSNIISGLYNKILLSYFYLMYLIRKYQFYNNPPYMYYKFR